MKKTHTVDAEDDVDGTDVNAEAEDSCAVEDPQAEDKDPKAVKDPVTLQNARQRLL